jgi:nitrogen fixation/metabolism regulation signal transduction histidine kinase
MPDKTFREASMNFQKENSTTLLFAGAFALLRVAMLPFLLGIIITSFGDVPTRIIVALFTLVAAAVFCYLSALLFRRFSDFLQKSQEGNYNKSLYSKSRIVGMVALVTPIPLLVLTVLYLYPLGSL